MFKNLTRTENRLPIILVGGCIILYLLILLYGLNFENSGSYGFRTLFSSRYGFPVMFGDPEQYIQISRNIFSNNVFSDHFNSPYIPNTSRTPGYPIFLALKKSVFGSYLGVSLIQIVLLGTMALMILKIGEKIHSITAGLVAALLFVLDPVAIAYTLLVSTDILFTFLVILIFYFIFFKSNKSYGRLFLYGLLLGVAIMVRPIGLFLLAVIIPGIFLCQADPFKIKIKRSLILFLATFLMIFPWMLRNKIIANSWSISSISSYDLILYNATNFADSKGEGKLISDQISAIIKKYSSSYPSDPADIFYSPVLTDLHHSDELNKISTAYIMSDPFGYAKFHLTRSMTYFFIKSSIAHAIDYAPHLRQKLIYAGIIPPSDKYTDLLITFKEKPFTEFIKEAWSNRILVFEKIVRLALLILMIIPVFLCKKEQRRYALFLWAMVLYFAILSGPLSNARYRIPAEPFMMLLSTIGVLTLISSLKVKRT